MKRILTAVAALLTFSGAANPQGDPPRGLDLAVEALLHVVYYSWSCVAVLAQHGYTQKDITGHYAAIEEAAQPYKQKVAALGATPQGRDDFENRQRAYLLRLQATTNPAVWCLEQKDTILSQLRAGTLIQPPRTLPR